MHKLCLFVLLMATTAPFSVAQSKPDAEVRSVVNHFQQALKERDVDAIERLVAKDLVVLENGHRNDGWQDFRDNHLIPEMREAAPRSKTELVKIVATSTMGWAYTRTTTSIIRKNGEQADAEVWSVYIVEKRSSKWKIVLLDWSIRFPKPPTSH